MDHFVYETPKATLKNRVQYITIEIAEGQYAGMSAGACGDSLNDSALSGLIGMAARKNGDVGYTKADVMVSFDTGWAFYTRFDITSKSTVHDILEWVDSEGRFYTGTSLSKDMQERYNQWKQYMNPDKVDGFTKLFATPQFNR